MTEKPKKKISKAILLKEYELSNSYLLNKQLQIDIMYRRKNRKLQKIIHERPSWREYVR